MHPRDYLLAPGGPAASGTPGHPRSPQVLRLESRVLDLELHGNGACQGHRVQSAANLGQHQVPPLEVSGETRPEFHLPLGYHEHWTKHLLRGSEPAVCCSLPSPLFPSVREGAAHERQAVPEQREQRECTAT